MVIGVQLVIFPVVSRLQLHLSSLNFNQNNFFKSKLAAQRDMWLHSHLVRIFWMFLDGLHGTCVGLALLLDTKSNILSVTNVQWPLKGFSHD